ncbi:MAG TPA: glycosyltransferase [Candidatus Angelobacter sp.]
MKILYVAYPLLTVSEDSAGGAEQMLWTLERQMATRGMHTIIAASAGSRVSGELFITGEPCSEPDGFDRRNREHQDKIVEFVRACEHQGLAFDLVHDKSGSFWQRASEMNVPVVATLHLPRHFYSAELFKNVPENVIFNCVSASQARSFADLNPTVVSNGILLDRFEPYFGPHAGLLWLGRICEEKAPHLALDIAERANQPITLAGQVYPFSYHQQYFEREVAPRLERMQNAVFIPAPSSEQKRQLLRECKAVLVTSLVDETSSLVAMEAAASGVPVIAFGRGALPEIVQSGVTGFVVDGVEEAVEALKRVGEIHPADCMKHARTNFSSTKMTDDYARLYKQMTEREVSNLLPMTL